MTKEARRIKFEDFVAHLPGLLEDVARDNEAVIVEMKGKLFRIEPTKETELPAGRHDPERVRKILAGTAGGFKGLDRRRFMADLHAGRQQASGGRPA